MRGSNAASFYNVWTGHFLRLNRFRARLRADLTAVLGLLVDGTLTAQVAARIPLNQARQAMELAESHTALGKVVLIPWHSPTQRRSPNTSADPTASSDPPASQSAPLCPSTLRRPNTMTRSRARTAANRSAGPDTTSSQPDSSGRPPVGHPLHQHTWTTWLGIWNGTHALAPT